MENFSLSGQYENATAQPDSNLTPPELLTPLLQDATLSDDYENTTPRAFLRREVLDNFTDQAKADLALRRGFKPSSLDAQHGGHFVQGPKMVNNNISSFGANYVPTGSNMEANSELGYLYEEPRDERYLLDFSPSKNQDMLLDSPGQQIVVHMNVPPTIQNEVPTVQNEVSIVHNEVFDAQNEVYTSDDFSSRRCIAKYLSLDPKIADLYYVGEIFKNAQNREIYLSIPVDDHKVFLLNLWIAERREIDHRKGFYF